eukprot:scaffold36336_cov57-Phaeocystis_antarctica.AAC.2
MAEQRAPHPKWMEAGRQWFFPESISAKRGRAAPIAPARLAPATSSGPERVQLTEMVALAEMADDETVAALHDIVSPGHADTGGLPRAAVGVPWAVLAGRWRSHGEAKRTGSSSASVTTSAYSCRSSSSSDASGPAFGSTATPVPPPFGAPAVPPAAPPVALPAPLVAPPPLPVDLAQ